MTKDEFVKLLDAYKTACDTVGYAGGQLYSLRDKADHASNPDDKQVYKGAIGQTNTTIEHNREIRDEIRAKIIDSFKGEEK